MSQNLSQIYALHPASSMQTTDLLYLGRSPFDTNSDFAITWANMQSSITGVGTITTGIWNGTIILPSFGGTGVNNGSNNITISGNVTFGGPFPFIATLTGATTLIFPTAGILATTSQLPVPAALTETNDTNVTLTLGGDPSNALLQATSITAGWAGTLSGARGGTGVANTGQTINLGAFSTGYVLTSDSSGNATWQAIPATTSAALTETNDTNVTLTLGGSPTTALLHATSITAGWTGTLAVGRGGLGIGTTPTNGQIPIGNGTNYTAATITAGTGIGVTNGSGSITIASTTSGFTTVTQSSASATLTPFSINIMGAGATLVTLALPASPTVGDTYVIVGASSGGWSVTAGGSQSLQISPTTSATSLSSVNRYDCVTITYSGIQSAVARFVCYAIQGNLTPV